ncbi:MAG: peptidylprolyl isomerase, partial [Chlorobium sp.]|nr:peptidylprolyl isomerase [Chlorobium sp.]
MKQFLVVLLFAIGFWTCNAQDTEKMKSKDVQTKKESKEMTVAIINTNMGKIEIELFADKTPKTVENFVGLAE